MIGRPLRHAIEAFSLMLMQSEADAERVRQLGAPATRVHVCGNLKYDFKPDESSITQTSESMTRIAVLSASESNIERVESFKNSDCSSASTPYPLIVAGSTAPGEEEMLLAALREVRTCTGLEDTRLLLAPRHPERFEEVARLIHQSQLKFVRRSEHRVNTHSTGSSESPRISPPVSDLSREERSCDVLLLDTIGELSSIYRFASVVFVGGSLVPRGGHNIIEPAAYAKPIIVGPHTENFRQIISDFIKEQAVIQIQSCDALSKELKRLLSHPEQAEAMGARACNILIANRGAAERTVAKIIDLMANQRQNRREQKQLRTV